MKTATTGLGKVVTAPAVRVGTTRFMGTVIDGARARIAAGWRVVAVTPNGVDVTKRFFGRDCIVQLRAKADGWS